MTSVLLLVAIALVLIGVVTLVVGIFSDTLVWVFVSIGSTVLAGLVLYILYRLGRRQVALAEAGDTRSPLYISIVSQIVVPIGICATLQATGHLHPAGIWTAIVLGHFTRMALSVWRFRQGKWRYIAVDLEPADAAKVAAEVRTV